MTVLDEQKKTILSMRNIAVEFPGVKALSGVDFNMESGRVYALAGANGSGKSTLMKVLSGVNNHYTGAIYIDGQEQKIRSPKAAKALGIETVYQEVDTVLLPGLSVAENIMSNVLVNGMGRKQFVNWKQIRSGAEEALKKIGAPIAVRAPVSNLTLAEKQLVLLARAVFERRRFLVLDEPTAPLSASETKTLFSVVRRLSREENTGIVFISHRLAELLEICEHITILKDGSVVKDIEITGDLRVDTVVEYMLGHKIVQQPREKGASGEILLEVDDLTETRGRVKNISLQVKSGEIVGIAGMVGAGKTELCKTIFGAYTVNSGAVKLRGLTVTAKTPSQAVQRGFALVPEERRREGIFIQEPLYTNITIASLRKFLNRLGFVAKQRRIDTSRGMIDALGIITPSAQQKVALLSGGNQQKVVVGKWLISDSELYIFDEPTKGIDVGAKDDLFRLIRELADRGNGILYASCEFAEVLSIADRAYIMFDGEIVKEVSVSESSETELLYYATGGK